MSVAKVHGANTHGYATNSRNAVGKHAHDGYRKALANAEIGQEVSMRVVNKLADQRFVAAFGDSRYVVESTVPLVVGETVKATVSAVGGIVELKYLGSGQFEAIVGASPAEPEYGDGPGGVALEKLAHRFRIVLTDEQRRWVESLSDSTADHEAMALGALYINKVGEPLDEHAAQAVYARVTWNDASAMSVVAQDISALLAGVQAGDTIALDTLAQALADTVDQPTTAPTGLHDGALAQSTAERSAQQFLQQDTERNLDKDNQALQELARHLLNKQDHSALAHRYGSLPVLIGGQLVELDLLMFRERESSTRGSAAGAGLKKLVMTLRTETLGRIEIIAQSFDSKLSVAITAQSAQSTELLSGHAREVKDLVARLGWSVDSVSYRFASDPARAAGQLAKHVLASGSVDALL